MPSDQCHAQSSTWYPGAQDPWLNLHELWFSFLDMKMLRPISHCSENKWDNLHRVPSIRPDTNRELSVSSSSFRWVDYVIMSRKTQQNTSSTITLQDLWKFFSCQMLGCWSHSFRQRPAVGGNPARINLNSMYSNAWNNMPFTSNLHTLGMVAQQSFLGNQSHKLINYSCKGNFNFEP